MHLYCALANSIHFSPINLFPIEPALDKLFQVNYSEALSAPMCLAINTGAFRLGMLPPNVVLSPSHA